MQNRPFIPAKFARNYSKHDVQYWNVARLIGEIYGWNHLTAEDWESLEACPPDGYVPGAEVQFLRMSIFEELEPLWRQCNEVDEDYSPLQPSERVDENLKALVSIICTRFKDKEITSDSGAHHYSVVQGLMQRLEHPSLKEKRQTLCQIAGFAEGEMEKHFNQCINRKIEQPDFIQHNALSTNATPEEKMQAFIDVMAPFPYPENYKKIVEAELGLMQRPLDPRFFRTEDVDAESVVDEGNLAQIQFKRVQSAASSLMNAIGTHGSLSRNIEPFSNKVITFPGSGGLPLTGIMLHIYTGARINLIDIDSGAVSQSRRLIANLENLGIVSEGCLQVIEGDVVDMRYQPREELTAASLLDAAQVRAHMRKDAQALFIKRKYTHRNAQDLPQNIERNDDALVDDSFQYSPHYSLPDVKTPLAVSFVGYKEVPDQSGHTCTMAHQIYFDKERGWHRSKDRRVVESDIVFLASLIAEPLRQQVADRIMRQTSVPDAIVMRSVKGLGRLVYNPTNTNRIADLRAPFYGEAVPRTHVLDGKDIPQSHSPQGHVAMMHPSLVPVDEEVLNSTEIHYLPFHRMLRERTNTGRTTLDRLKNMESQLRRVEAKMVRIAGLANQQNASAGWALRDMGVEPGGGPYRG